MICAGNGHLWPLAPTSELYMSVNSYSSTREPIVPPLSWDPFWSCCRNWFLKFPSWPSRTAFTHLSTRCFLPLWWARVKKKLPPSSPTLLLLAKKQDDKSKSFTSEQLQQYYCTFKGRDGTLWDDRVLIWKCCLLPAWDHRRPARCVRLLCAALTILTSVLEEKCHSLPFVSLSVSFFSHLL